MAASGLTGSPSRSSSLENVPPVPRIAPPVADVAPEILRHRLILTYDALADGITTDDVISRIVATMPVPQVTPRQESGLQETA